jgi:Holliday junction DNA helicase RuvB
MENFQIDFVVDKGPYAKTVNFNLKPFTLIGATTRSGLLASPLRDRFGMFYHLEFYAPEQIKTILLRAAQKLKVEITDEAASVIARRSRGTPRIANRLLRRVRDFAQVKTPGECVDVAIVDQTMASLRVDQYGLDELDRRLITVIGQQYKGGPVGVEALAATLNEEVDTIEDVIEPYLLKSGFLKRTKRGRELTDQAMKHVLGQTLSGKNIQKELY